MINVKGKPDIVEACLSGHQLHKNLAVLRGDRIKVRGFFDPTKYLTELLFGPV